jgi:hypothetical protein
VYYYILDILTGTPLTEMVYVPDTVGIPFSNRVMKFSNIKEARAWWKKKSKQLNVDMSKYEIVWNPHKD